VRRFNMNISSRQRATGGFTVTGSLTFADLQNKLRLQSTGFQSFQLDATGTRAIITLCLVRHL